MNIKTIFFVFAFCLNLVHAQTKTGKDFYLIDIPENHQFHPEDKKLMDSILPLYHNSNIDTFKIYHLRILSEYVMDNALWPKYNSILYENVKDASDNFSLRMKASALNNMGYQKQYFDNNLDEAIKYYTEALAIFRKADYKTGIAIQLNNIAYIHQHKGDIIKCIQLYTEANSIFLKQNNHQGLVSTSINLGQIYRDNEDLQKAEEYYKLAYYYARLSANKTGQGASLNQLADVYLRAKNFEKARKYFFMTLKIQKEINDADRIASACIGIGITYLEQKNYEKTKEYYKMAIFQLNQTTNSHTKASVYDRLADFFCMLGDDKLCAQYSDSAYVHAKNIGYPKVIVSASKKLGEFYAKKGNTNKAYFFIKESYDLQDSLFNDKKRKEEIKEQYKSDYEKKTILLKEEQLKKELVRQAQQRNQRYFTISLFVVIFSILTILFFVYKNFRAKKRSELILQEKNKLIHHQKAIVEEKQKEILDSINYARRIQYALLAHEDFISRNLKEYFVFFQPKDIVSGDFYWATKSGNKFYLAVCDSTGHGVPGAFMSLLNISFLNEAINERQLFEPNIIFDYVRNRLVESISKENQKDGFDGVLLCFEQLNTNETKITYAAANNAPVLIKNNELAVLPCDRMPVGQSDKKETFTLHTINFQKGDMLYVYTDGYADQFGGEKGKKLKYKPLNELILSLHKQPLNQQRESLSSFYNQWKGSLEQIDDVCLMGIKL